MPAQGMPRQRRAEETRERILQAAQEAFAHSGYDATGVAEICERADVTKGAFYHHFSSKQAVFLALLERWLSGLDAQLAALRATAASVPQALLEMVGMIQRVFRASGKQLPLLFEFWTQAMREPTIWQATIAPYRRYRAFFTELVAQGVREGSLHPVDPVVAAEAIVSLAMGLLLQALLDPQGGDWGQALENGMRLLLSGLEKGV